MMANGCLLPEPPLRYINRKGVIVAGLPTLAPTPAVFYMALDQWWAH